MRIHADRLTRLDFRDAAQTAGVTIEKLSEHGSRSRTRAFDVTLSGDSKRRPNRDHASDEFAATWDQWGTFLAYLFYEDGSVTIPSAYKSEAEFHTATARRFFDVYSTPSDMHGDHTFRYAGVPRSQSCTKCTATKVW